jgi:hypothetical protein
MTDWQSIYDKEAKAYYYWNPKTNETTWDEPEELKNEKPTETKEDEMTEEQKKAAEDYYNSKEYYDWYMENMALQAQQTASAQFAAYSKSDKFTHLDSNPLPDSSVRLDPHEKAFNQMNFFFDVEQYQRDRAADRENGKVRKKLSQKEIAKFKKKKIEKKRASLIARMGADA